MVSSIVQPGVLNGTPIVARNPPPEGQMAVQLPVTLTPSIFATNGLQQLSSATMGGMSQVVTLIVDNTANNVPVTIVHGALNESVQVAANTQATVPTFSGQGYWPWQVFVSTAPAANVNVGLILLNYERSSGIYRQTSNTIQNTGENSSVLYSNNLSVSTATDTLLIPAGPVGSLWVFDSHEMIIEQLSANAAGPVSVYLTLQIGSGAGGIVFNARYPSAESPGASVQNNIPNATYRTWPQGLLINSNAAIYLRSQSLSNLEFASVTINLSGYNVAMGT